MKAEDNINKNSMIFIMVSANLSLGSSFLLLGSNLFLIINISRWYWIRLIKGITRSVISFSNELRSTRIGELIGITKIRTEIWFFWIFFVFIISLYISMHYHVASFCLIEVFNSSWVEYEESQHRRQDHRIRNKDRCNQWRANWNLTFIITRGNTHRIPRCKL